MSESPINRRAFFKKSIAAIGVGSGAMAHAASCIRTRSQTEGPYYPEKDLSRDQDLTRLDPKGADADGTIIELSGVIQDSACTPVSGALVEIWQANAHGKYDHSQDLNPLPKDPNFQHWGRVTTRKDGLYLFRTIIPGHYPLDPALVGKAPSGPRQYRPPHIHMKVHARGFQVLTTQLYFHEDSYSDTTTQDLVKDLNNWESVPADLKIRFLEDPKDKTKPRLGSFSVTLAKR